MSNTTKNSVESAKKHLGSSVGVQRRMKSGNNLAHLFCGQGRLRPGTYRWKVVGNSQKMVDELVHGLGCELGMLEAEVGAR